MDKRALSIYVHIPFCKAKCSYCDFLSFGGCSYSEQRQYVEALCNEIRAYKEIAGEYEVQTVFFGGGTPSYIDEGLLCQILATIMDTFAVNDMAEITLEGNPDSLIKNRLAAYHGAGFNRLSIGLQSANDSLLKALGRIHNFDQFVAAFQSARQEGFTNINVDVMSGLPGEDEISYIHTLAKVVKLAPEHISAYSLMVEEGTSLADNEELLALLPSEELDRLLYRKTKQLLSGSGYKRYEISNYAKEGYACKHNLVYWTGGEYLGVGLGASSCLKVLVSEHKWETIRFHGVENLSEYIGRFLNCDGMREDDYTNLYHSYEEEATGEEAHMPLNPYREYEQNMLLEFVRDFYKDLYFSKRKDEMEEFMFLGLRLTKGIAKREFYERFGVAVEDVYSRVISKRIEQGLLVDTGEELRLSDKGMDVSNTVMADFML